MTLTKEERERLRDNDSWDELDAAVESIVASRERAAAEKAWDEGYEGCCEISREENESHDYCRNPYRLGDDRG